MMKFDTLHVIELLPKKPFKRKFVFSSFFVTKLFYEQELWFKFIYFEIDLKLGKLYSCSEGYIADLVIFS